MEELQSFIRKYFPATKIMSVPVLHCEKAKVELNNKEFIDLLVAKRAILGICNF